jgi:hypothetical protein
MVATNNTAESICLYKEKNEFNVWCAYQRCVGVNQCGEMERKEKVSNMFVALCAEIVYLIRQREQNSFLEFYREITSALGAEMCICDKRQENRGPKGKHT